jgi:hypothetical protein
MRSWRRRIGERVHAGRPFSAWLLATTMCAGAAVAGCGSDAATATAPTQLKCQVAVAAPAASIGPEGGTGTLTVTTSPECPWDASTGANWLTNLSPASGQGTGTVEFRAAPNPLPSVREGDIVVNDNRVRVSQQAAACRMELRPASVGVEAGGGTREVAVSTSSGCSWTAATDAGWISFTTPVTGSGDGSVGVSIAPHRGAERRVGAVVVGDQRVIVTQEPEVAAPAPGCVYRVNSTSQGVLPSEGAEVSASVSVASGCAWTATSSVPWVTIRAGATGTGNGTVSLNVAANPGGARTGTVTVAGQTFMVSQAASAAPIPAPTPTPAPAPCNYSIAPPEAAIAASGGSGAITVSTGVTCAWTAASNAAWITVVSGGSGTGTGAVAYSVAANPGVARTGTVAVAGQTFTVTQAAASCSYALSPTQASIAAAGGSGTFAVTAGDGCSWTASSTAAWVTVTSGTSGSGSGAIAFTVTANPEPAVRTAGIVIAGQTFTVTQAPAAPQAPCIYSIAPANAAIGVLGGPGTLSVTAGEGCAWTAATTATWITVTSGASGSGNGAVGFSVAPNLGGARTGTIIAAGQTFTVTQAAAIPCTYAINPTSVSVDDRQREGTVAVVAAGGCEWTATSNVPWITITSGVSGTGSGSVGYRVERNRGGSRTGTLTIAGRTFTVSQDKAD